MTEPAKTDLDYESLYFRKVMECQHLVDWLNDLGHGWCDQCYTPYRLPDPRTCTGSTTCPECGPQE